MQSTSLINKNFNELEQYDDLIETYYHVYVLPHLDGILGATTDKIQAATVTGLIRSANTLTEDDYRQKVRSHYPVPGSEDTITIFIFMRRLWTGELKESDKIITHLRKLSSSTRLTLDDLCTRISSKMGKLITDYISAKDNLNVNKENTYSPAPDSPDRFKPTSSKPIPIQNDPRMFHRAFLSMTPPYGGRSSPRFLEEYCRSPRSPRSPSMNNREPRL